MRKTHRFRPSRNVKIESKYTVGIVLTVLICLFFISKSFSFYGDVDHHETSVTVSVAGQNDTNVGTLTGIYPLAGENAWLGAYVSRQTVNNEVVSQLLNTHVQGGLDLKRIRLEGYVEAERDKIRMVELGLETGYFFQPRDPFMVGEVEFSLGAGNYTERRDLDDAIGRAEDDKETTFGWLAFVEADYKQLSAVFRYKPSIDFENTALELSTSFYHNIDDNMTLRLTTLTSFDDSLRYGARQTNYLIGIQWRPN